MARLRILSLDGGGVRGAYAAAVLAEIEERSPIPLVSCFDLITGTSTGGILAIGLALGKSAADLVSFYEQEATSIFPSTGVLAGIRRHGIRAGAGSWLRRKNPLSPKHEAKRLEQVLDRQFAGRQLGEARTRLVITSYNASEGNQHLFKTFHHAECHRHYTLPVTQIALATAAAPAYFEAQTLPLGKEGKPQVFLDGGVWANAPTIVGITEAVRYLGARVADVHMLSVGTGFKPFKITKALAKGGKAQWALAITDFLLGASQASAVGTANTLLPERFMRIQTMLDVEIPMDYPKHVGKMIEFGRWDGKQRSEEVVRRFCDAATPPFVPVERLDR